MKLTIAWNVWNNYLDTALGSEIFRRENEEKKIFDEVHLISQGGYPEPPSKERAQYLDGHFVVPYPEVPLIQTHTKFKGVFRVIEGMQRAFRYAEARGHEYVVVTNADAWFLSLEKLNDLLQDEHVKQSAVSMRVGWLTGLTLNFGNRVPLMDDHFMMFNIAECKKYGVFDYDHFARFFSPHFGNVGGMHYILMCFVDQRVPKGKFHIYSDLSDTINHYGDWMGWNLLPWQYQLSTGFLHANAAQVPSLDRLRAAFLDDLGFTRYPLIAKYCRGVAPDGRLFRRRHGVLVYKKPVKRAVKEAYWWWSHRAYWRFARRRYEKNYTAMDSKDVHAQTLQYFDKYHHIKPYWLTQ